MTMVVCVVAYYSWEKQDHWKRQMRKPKDLGGMFPDLRIGRFEQVYALSVCFFILQMRIRMCISTGSELVI